MEQKTWLVVLCAVCFLTSACDITFNIPVDFGGLGNEPAIGNGSRVPIVDADAASLDAGSPDADGFVSDASVSADAASHASPGADAAGSDDRPDVGAVGDAGRPSDGGPVVDASSLVIAVSTAPSQCWGRRLATTNEYVRLAAAGMSVWHICYHTALWDAVVPGADPRPARVVFYRYDSEMCTMVDFVEATAPSAANPWTANIMVALPTASPGYPPFFNIANVRDGGSVPDIIWAVQENEPGTGRLALNGVIQVWRVGADGSQTLSQPGMTCTDPTSGSITDRASFFAPSSEVVSGARPLAAACGGTPYACSTVPH